MEQRSTDLSELERFYPVSLICRSLLSCILRPYGFLTKEQLIHRERMITYTKTIFRLDHTEFGNLTDEILRLDSDRQEVVVAVSVIEARELPAMDSNGLADPYCILTLSNESAITFNSTRRHARQLRRLIKVTERGRKSSGVGQNSVRKISNESRNSSAVSSAFEQLRGTDGEGSPDKLDNVRKTEVARMTLAPKWHETFFIRTSNFKEKLMVYVFDNDDDYTLGQSFKNIRGAIGCMVFLIDACRSIGHTNKQDDFFGYCKIKLRAVPSTGLEDWFRIKHVRLAHRYHHHNSACRLKVVILNPEIMTLAGGPGKTSRDYVRARSYSISDVAYWPIDFLLITWKYALLETGTCLIRPKALSLARSRSSTHTLPTIERVISQVREEQAAGDLRATVFDLIVDIFSTAHFISHFQIKLIRLTAILWLLGKQSLRYDEFEPALKQGIQDAEEAMWFNSGICLKQASKLERRDFAALAKKRVCFLFETALVSFLKWYFKVYIGHLCIDLFPLNSTNVPRTVCIIAIPLRLLNVSAGTEAQYCECDSQCIHCDVQAVRSHRHSAQLASNMMAKEIRRYVHLFVDKSYKTSHIVARTEVSFDEAKLQINTMLEVLASLMNEFEVSVRYREHFEKFSSINYAVCVAVQLDEDLSPLLRVAIDNANRYQAKVKMNPHAFFEISKLSLDLYFAIKKFTILLHQFISDNQELSINDYVEWFQESSVFWLDTFRDQSRTRLLRALEFDKEMIQVTNTSRYSTSTVDVLSVFSTMLEEWNKIYINNAEYTVFGIVKITEFICEGSRLYTEKILQILKKNGIHEYDDSKILIPDQLCIAVNNIEKVRSSMVKLQVNQGFLNVIKTVAERHNRPEFVTSTLNTLRELIGDADGQIVSHIGKLEDTMARIVQLGVLTHGQPILQNPNRTQMDQLIQYFKVNYRIAAKWLKQRVRRRVLIKVWESSLTALVENIEFGRNAEYYSKILHYCQELREYFQEWDPSLSEEVLYTETSTRFAYSLAYRTKSTTHLGMEFYKWVMNDVLTQRSARGTLTFKAGFVREVNEISTIIIKDISLHLNDEAALGEGGSEVSVRFDLLPASAFTSLAYSTSRLGPCVMDLLGSHFGDSKMNFYRVATSFLADSPNAVIAKWLRDYQAYSFNKYVEDDCGHDGYAVLRMRFMVSQHESIAKIGSMIRSGSIRKRRHEYGTLVNLDRLREVPADSVIFVPTVCSEDKKNYTEVECLDSECLELLSCPVFSWDENDQQNNDFRKSSCLPNCVMVLSERTQSDEEARSILSSAPPFFRST